MKLSILIPVRAKLLCSFQCETPCTTFMYLPRRKMNTFFCTALIQNPCIDLFLARMLRLVSKSLILQQKKLIKKYKTNYDGVVICAGVMSKQFASKLGDNVNIYPVKGYSITLLLNDAKSIENAPYVSLLDDKAKIVSSRLGKDRFRVAGTAEFNGYNQDIRADRINPLINWCNKLFPLISTEHAIPWAGLRPMTPSMIPKVGSGKLPGIFYNTGHGHLGWTLSAFTAQQISDHIVRKDNLVK